MSSKTASKADTYNSNKPLTQLFKYDDLYEYKPVTKVYEYKPKKGDKAKKTITAAIKTKRGETLSTEPRSKKVYSSVVKTTTTTTATGAKNLTLDKYAGKIKKMKTPSFSVQKDRIITTYVDPTKGAKDKNNRYLLSPF